MTKELITTNTELSIAADIEALTGMTLDEIQELDFSCIPVIVNDGDIFKVKGTFDWEVNSKDGFDAIILSAKPYQYYRCSDETNPVMGFYCHDGEHTAGGQPLTDVTDKWEADGTSFAIKDYIAVHLLLTDDGPAFNALAILTLSPTSIKRFKAYVNIVLKRQHKTLPSSVVTHFSLSEPLKSSNNQSFRTTESSFVGYTTQSLLDKIEG